VPVLAMMDRGERTTVKKQNKKGLPCSHTVFKCFSFGGGKVGPEFVDFGPLLGHGWAWERPRPGPRSICTEFQPGRQILKPSGEVV
jgi:hypothetical protein